MYTFKDITPQGIIAIYNDALSNQSPYLGEELFVPKKQMSIKLEMISGKSGLPVLLAPTNFDADITTRPRLGVEITETRMPFFREKMVINEEDRMNLMMFAHDSAKMAIMEKIFDDNSNLIRGARAAREKMAMDLISTGKVEIKNNGVSFAYNYQLEKKQFVKTPEGKPWSDRKNSNPIQDIIDWKRLGKTLGMDLRRAVCSSLTWSYLLTNENIKADMIASSINAAALTVTDANLRQHILAKTGVEVVEYSEYYQLKVGVGENPYPFYPDNKFTMMPVAALGNMMFGPTPEEIDLMGGTMNANTKITDMGVAVTTEVISRPTVNTETRVSQIVLPSLNSAGGNLIIATVV